MEGLKSQSIGSRSTRSSSSSNTSNSDQSIRSARAVKVFGDLVCEDDKSLCYSPSPMKNKRAGGLRNITNTCDTSPSRVLPFGTIAFTAKKEKSVKIKVAGGLNQSNKCNKGRKIQCGKRNAEFDKATVSVEEKPKMLGGSSASMEKTKRFVTSSKSKAPPTKKHAGLSKFKSNIQASSAARKVQAKKTQNALFRAEESVNQTLNATRMAIQDHRQQVAKDVARLRNEWIAEKEEAAKFYNEVQKTKREMLNLRNQLSSQYAQNKADNDRLRLQQRLNDLDKEIAFKSDVFVKHKQKLKDNEDKRRRMSVALKTRIISERREAEERLKTERMQEEHERLELKWAGEKDAEEYLRQCEQDRRESFAFRNAEGKMQRIKHAEKEAEEAQIKHERYELKWAGEKDAEKYLEECKLAKRDSFAYRNAEGRVQRMEQAEREAAKKYAEHESYELKWAGERDADEYKKKCDADRRMSFAFRNAEARAQRMQVETKRAEEKVKEHEHYELKWAGEKDAENYLKKLDCEKRDSFAFRNIEGRRQRMEQEERCAQEKLAEHERYERKWAGERDAEEYRKHCAKERRDSFAFRGRECVLHRELMKELKDIVKEQEHESFVLKWAAQDDVKKYLRQVADDRRKSFAFRNAEAKRHRDLEEQWRCDELERQHKLEIDRAGGK